MSKYYYLRLALKEAIDLFNANDERLDIRADRNGRMIIIKSIRELYMCRDCDIYSKRLTEGHGWKEK